MAKQESVFIFIGTYPDEGSARDDYQVVKDLHSAGAVGTYDAAVVTKDNDGKVHVNKDEMPTRHGAWGGAVVGIFFPPSIISTAALGAAVGGVGGHLWRGMSRADVKELGDLVTTGTATRHMQDRPVSRSRMWTVPPGRRCLPPSGRQARPCPRIGCHPNGPTVHRPRS